MAELSLKLKEKILLFAMEYRQFEEPIKYTKAHGEELHLLYILIEALKSDIVNDMREETERKANRLFLT